MAEIDYSAVHEGLEVSRTADLRTHRPARSNELSMVHDRLVEAVNSSEFYSDEFKAYETARLTVGLLRDLIAVDARHVLICLDSGRPIGFQITGPELGTLWLYWSYMFPEERKHVNPMRYMPALIKTWDNDRFHKVATYVRPTNRVAIALSRRAKLEHVVTLKNHIFGEDFMLFECPLTKAVGPYDHGVNLSLAQRLGNRALSTVGL